jgi:hypothetical protein
LGDPREALGRLELVNFCQFALVGLCVVFTGDVKGMPSTGKDFIHDDASGPNVDTFRVLMIMDDYFRGHVDHCAALLVQAALSKLVLGREPEVNYLTARRVIEIVYKDVV